MIKAVIFDYGNVVSVTKTGDCADEMEKITGVPSKIFRTVYENYGRDFDMGLITGTEMYKKLLKSEGYTDLSNNKELMQHIANMDMQSWREYRQDVTDWAIELQKNGYKIGILSNMPTEFLENYGNEIPIFKIANYACFSCNVKKVKPDFEIYYEALSGLNVKPNEAIFFDDLQENIDAACKIGIHGCLWKDLTYAKIFFNEHKGENKK